jgi:heme/copper-type cytochrome/quinol oxidase subunit 3
MEIPFIVNARKDTGLFNSKVGIWLFLASEVTLFGGLFSGYLFLRLYADYPWPERALPVLPGLINTFVLIGSSVTVGLCVGSIKDAGMAKVPDLYGDHFSLRGSFHGAQRHRV